MNTKDAQKQKICCFYVNDVHLEIMLLPYINKKIEEKEQIYLVNENNLEDSVNKVINKLNLNNIKRQEILKLEWNNENDEKIEKINICENKATIIINGSENFNKKINKQIIRRNNLSIINCYNLEDIENIENIKNDYTHILNTTGIKNLYKTIAKI